MTTLTIILMIAATVGTPILAVVILQMLANRSIFLTTIELGSIVFINVGETMKHIWANVRGFMLSESIDPDGQRWLIPVPRKTKGKEEEKGDEWRKSFFRGTPSATLWWHHFLWDNWGIRPIAVFWPHTHVAEIELSSRLRIKESPEAAEEPLRKRVVSSGESTRVRSLLFMVPRPVFVGGLELPGDNARINILALPIYQLVIPYLPVYIYKGDFFPPLDAAIEAAMVDFVASHRVAVYKEGDEKGQFAGDSYDELPTERKELCEPAPLTYFHWLQLTKAGENSPMERHLRPLNASETYVAELRRKLGAKDQLVKYVLELTRSKPAAIRADELKKLIPSGIIPRFGFALSSFRVVAWEPHGDTADLDAALRLKETRFHEAEGVRMRAAGERDAFRARADGESERYNKLVTALIANGVTPDVAAEVVRTQLRAELIGGKDSKIVTYVEGGASASVMVPSQPSSTTRTPNK